MAKSKTITKICAYCKLPFDTNRNAQQYCSLSCSSSSRKTRDEEYYIRKQLSLKMECAFCGKTFVHGRRKQYCSNECRLQANGRGGLKDYLSDVKHAKPDIPADEVERRARAEGLTYGQYVAKYRLS
jgi:hypothetical protein